MHSSQLEWSQNCNNVTITADQKFKNGYKHWVKNKSKEEIEFTKLRLLYKARSRYPLESPQNFVKYVTEIAPAQAIDHLIETFYPGAMALNVVCLIANLCQTYQVCIVHFFFFLQ